jgi:hypothetical protein
MVGLISLKPGAPDEPEAGDNDLDDDVATDS